MLTQPAVAEEPEDLGRLRDSWTRARAQATSPIDKKYADALSLLKVRFTKEGNLEAALAVDTELKKLTAFPAAFEAPSAEANTTLPRKEREGIENSLLGNWDLPGGGYGEFRVDNIWSFSNIKSKYTVEKTGEIVITNDAKQSARLQMSEDHKSLKGTWFDGNPIELVRRPL